MKKLLSIFAVLVICFLQVLPVAAVPPMCVEKTVNVASSDTAISFGGTFSHVIIKTSTSADIVYVSPNNTTATTADFQIDPGAALSFGLAGQSAGIPGFHYIGATATGTLSYMAY